MVLLHRHHILVKKLSGELHNVLKVCIRLINKIKAHPLNLQLSAMLYEVKIGLYKSSLAHGDFKYFF